jgi:hypothetical protein
MCAGASELQYAPRPRVRRAWVRRVTAFLLAGLVVAFGIVRGPAAWNQMTMLYWQRQCLRYSAPADQLICTEPLPFGGQTPPFSYSRVDPKALTRFQTNVIWSGSSPNLRRLGSGPVIYMGERTTRSGLSRLVIVRRVWPASRLSFDAPMAFDVTIIRQGSWLQQPAAVTIILPDVVPSAFDDGTGTTPSTRFFAGQSDPANGDHFIFSVETETELRHIRGRLADPLEKHEWPTVELVLQ